MHSINPIPPVRLPDALENDPEHQRLQAEAWKDFYFRSTLQDFVNVWWRRLLRRLTGKPAWIDDEMMAPWTRIRTRRKYNW